MIGRGRAMVFTPNGVDPRQIKRFRAYVREGLDPVGFSFTRMRFNRDFQPEWRAVDLGMVRDRAYVRRVASLARAVRVLWQSRALLREAAVFHAINLDMAVLALVARRMAGSKAPVIYEVGDIPPLFLAHGPAGRALRGLERRVLDAVDMLVVTSPGFVRNYFRPVQRYDGATYVLENKPSAADLARARAEAPNTRVENGAGGRRWRVGYFGALRCARSWRMIQHLAGSLPDRVEFVLRGYPTRLDRDAFERGIAAHENIRYEGEYRAPDALPALYGSVDFAWGFEFMDESANSRWLLPNRLYEAGAFGVPILAARGYETGRVVEELGIGWAFEEPIEESLLTFFRDLVPEEYRRRRDAYARVPAERFASDEDFSRLCAELGIARASTSGGAPALRDSA